MITVEHDRETYFYMHRLKLNETVLFQIQSISDMSRTITGYITEQNGQRIRPLLCVISKYDLYHWETLNTEPTIVANTRAFLFFKKKNTIYYETVA